VTVVDSTLAPSPVDVSTIEEPTETTNTLLFDSIEGFDVDGDETAPVGVNAGASGDLTVSASDVTGHPGDGVLVDATEADVVLNESTTVTDSGARGVGVASGDGLTIDNAVVANSTDIGVDVAADVDLTITEATIEDGSATGVLLDADLAGAEISQTTIANNTAPDITAAGLDLTTAVDAANLTVRANAFENNDFGISAADEPLDATLNYFGDRNGPAAAGGDSVSENVIYDPFLSEDRTDTSPAAIESTTDFAHDVIVPAPEDGGSTFVAVGFPAQLEGVGVSGDATVDDYIDPSYKGNVYAFYQSNNSFAPVSGDTEIDAFDALVVENDDTEDRVISIEYRDSRSPSAITDNRLEFDSGLNFVAPQQAGQVDEVLFPGGDTDAVVQPFAAGENLYGAESADQVRDQFVTPDGAQEVSSNFRSGAGDAIVHPHVGYFVIVNEDANDGLTVTEKIPVPASPTADNVANRTDATGDGIFTITDLSTSQASPATAQLSLRNIGAAPGEQTVEVAAFGGAEPVTKTTSVQIDADSTHVESYEFTVAELAEAGFSDGDDVAFSAATAADEQTATLDNLDLSSISLSSPDDGSTVTGGETIDVSVTSADGQGNTIEGENITVTALGGADTVTGLAVGDTATTDASGNAVFTDVTFNDADGNSDDTVTIDVEDERGNTFTITVTVQAAT
jgi:hypothetical protein